MSDENEMILRNALDAVDRGRRWTLVGVVALFTAMAIALAAMMAVAAHTGSASSDALLLKTVYVAAAAQMLFVACCTAAVMFQFTRLTKSILRALDSR
jgi:Tfp pilus assembly protein PilN